MCIRMENRLRHSLDAWKRVNASPTLLGWIDEGVPLSFKKMPNHTFIPNQKLSPKHESFVRSEIQELMNNGSIERCVKKPKFISPISVVPKRNNKLRMIHNLKVLNEYIECPTFRSEDIRTTMDLIECDDLMTSIDIRNCFHHIPVHPMYRDYLGFMFDGKFYRWCVTPFGLNVSPFYCNKFLRPIIAYLRSILNIRVQVYVDDFICLSKSTSVTDHTDSILQVLADCGWLVNWEKSCLSPATTIVYIGFEINSRGKSGYPELWISRDRRRKLRYSIRQLLSKPFCTARQLARVLGRCISTSVAVRFGKIMLRESYQLLNTRTHWETILKLSDGTKTDLKWWLVEILGSRRMIIQKRTVDCFLEVDASQIAWGAHMNGVEAAGLWNARLSFSHSNTRELMAILMALKSFRPQIKNKVLEVYTDNITARSYLVHQGGPNAELNKIAKAIWSIASTENVYLIGHYIKGSENIEADRLSREVDPYCWKLNPEVFQKLEFLYGPHTIDRFADFLTTQIPDSYNSRYSDPGSSGINALVQTNWQRHNNYCCPPFRLLGQLVDTIITQRARATVVAPFWPAQPWCQKLLAMSVHRPILIGNNKNNFVQVSRFVKPEPLKNTKWLIAVWRVCGKRNY